MTNEDQSTAAGIASRLHVQHEYFRKNWLRTAADVCVRVDPEGKTLQRGSVAVVELQILAVAHRDGEHWIARFAEATDFEISKHRLTDLMDEVERLLEEGPWVTKHRSQTGATDGN